MKYKVLSDKDYKLSDRVQTYIKDGWKPLGGVAIVNTGFNTYLYQAIVKEETK